MPKSHGEQCHITGSQVVEEESAILGLPDGQEWKVYRSRSHTGICKFSSYEDQELKKVLVPLLHFAKAATSSFDYSPTRNVRAGLLRNELLLLDGMYILCQNITPTGIGPMYSKHFMEVPESVSSLENTESYVHGVLVNTDHLEIDLQRLERSMDDENSIIYGILRWFAPIAILLLNTFFFGGISAPAIWAFGGARTLMEKHEQGLQSQRRVVQLQEEAITLLDDRRASALPAMAMIQLTKHGALSMTADIPYLEARLDDLETRLLRRVEWILRELQSRNQKLIDEQQDLREAEEFRDSAEGKNEEEILAMAKEKVEQIQARQNNSPGRKKPWCSCIIL